MNYYIIKISGLYGCIRTVTVKAYSKREALDSVETEADEVISSCCELN